MGPMRAWLSVLPLLTALACTLPLEDKTACEDSFDCLDGRACVQGQCTDDACGLACGALCNARSTCDAERSCDEVCDPAQTALASLDPAECGVQYDRLADASCDNLACFDACAASCERAVECALIDDASACTLHCQLDPAPCPAQPESCTAPDAREVGCWSRGEFSGC